MGHRFAEIAFTESVHQVQQELGSRAGYAGMDTRSVGATAALGPGSGHGDTQAAVNV